MQNAGLDESQAGIKIAGRNISNLRYADNATLVAEREEELKSLLMRVKKKSERLAWNATVKKKKKLRSWHPVPSLWQTEGEKVEVVADFIFLGFKIFVDSDCSQKNSKTLVPWKENYDKSRQHIKK